MLEFHAMWAAKQTNPALQNVDITKATPTRPPRDCARSIRQRSVARTRAQSRSGSFAVRADGGRCAAQALSEKINALQDYVMANCSLADPLSQRVLKLVTLPPSDHRAGWDHRAGVGSPYRCGIGCTEAAARAPGA